MKKKTILFLIIIFNVFTLFAAGVKEQSSLVKLYEFTDSYNRSVQVVENPQRIISLGPNVTEIVSELNFSTLVGRTDYCNYPEEVVNVESIGNILNANIEKIVTLEPDLIIGSAHCPKELLERLTNLGIPSVAIYDDNSLEGSYNIISQIGKLMNKEDEANKIIEDNKTLVNKVVSKVKNLEKKTVYYVVGFGQWGDFTAGGDTFIGELISLANGDNIAKDVKGWNFSAEMLIDKDPEIIIVSKHFDSKNLFTNNKPYSFLTAVKENRVFEIDNDLLDRQGIRNAEGLLQLAKIIHNVQL